MHMGLGQVNVSSRLWTCIRVNRQFGHPWTGLLLFYPFFITTVVNLLCKCSSPPRSLEFVSLSPLQRTRPVKRYQCTLRMPLLEEPLP